MGPLHLYVVRIVCGGRESQRGVFLKRALGPPILRKYAYRSRFRFRKCASSSPWRGGGMSLSSEIVRGDFASLHEKAGVRFSRGSRCGEKASENARRFCSFRLRQRVSVRIGVGLRSSQRVFSEMRTPSALGGAEFRIAN